MQPVARARVCVSVSVSARMRMCTPAHQWEENLFQPTNHTPSNTPQDAIGLLGHKGTVLVHGHPAVHQEPQVPFPYVALQTGSLVYWYLYWYLGLFLLTLVIFH